jgi:hypothetical protein
MDCTPLRLRKSKRVWVRAHAPTQAVTTTFTATTFSSTTTTMTTTTDQPHIQTTDLSAATVASTVIVVSQVPADG